MKPLFDFWNLTRWAIGREYYLLLSVIESIERVKEFFLSPLLPRDELNVIY